MGAGLENWREDNEEQVEETEVEQQEEEEHEKNRQITMHQNGI